MSGDRSTFALLRAVPKPKVDTSIAGTPKVATPRRLIVREELMAQDGQTAGETAVYDALWAIAESKGSTGPVRQVTAGYGEIARHSGQAVNTVKANLRNLAQKLSIDSGGKHAQGGTTYTVHGYREILLRRREVGLTHYVKMNGSKQYADPKTGTPIVGTPKLTIGIPKVAIAGVPRVDSSGVPKVDTYPYRKRSIEIEQEARAILSDPKATENEQAAARAVLGENNP